MSMMPITRESFSVIGRQGQGPSRFGQTWIRPLWRDLHGEFDAIAHLVKRGPDGGIAGTWGLMSGASVYLAPWGEEGRYLAGCETNPGVSPPRGWALWHVPAQTYFVAACRRGQYQQTYERVVGELLAGGRYNLSGAAHERYPADRPDEIELYIPVIAN